MSVIVMGIDILSALADKNLIETNIAIYFECVEDNGAIVSQRW